MRKNPLWIVAVIVIPLCIFSFSSLYGASKEQPLPPGCAGVKTCECCHQDVMESLGKTEMGRLFLKHPRTGQEELVCETCHGPGKDHADSEGQSFGGMIRFAKGSPTPLEQRNQACLQCHQKRGQLFWEGSPHEMRNVSCSNCHNVHSKSGRPYDPKLLALSNVMETCDQCHKQEVAQQMRFSHHPLREGKMNCTSCHNPHGTAGESMLKANSLNDLCYKCHTEVRGPFLFEHPPVRENCGYCHSSHGSVYPKLLKVPELRLCRECHINFHQLSRDSKGRRTTPQLAGPLCTSCHFNVHGSNHPSGFVFTR